MWVPGGQVLQVDWPDEDWKVPGLQMAGSALPCGQAWPGGHWHPVTQRKLIWFLFVYSENQRMEDVHIKYPTHTIYPKYTEETIFPEKKHSWFISLCYSCHYSQCGTMETKQWRRHWLWAVFVLYENPVGGKEKSKQAQQQVPWLWQQRAGYYF